MQTCLTTPNLGFLQSRGGPYISLDDLLHRGLVELGPSQQVLEKALTIEKLQQYIADQGLARRGKHHEIYLSDPRCANPARLKTIIRQPVE